MELAPQEKSHAWWKGTVSGALKGMATGLLIGAASALLLEFVLIPVLPAIGLPAIGNAFAAFLTLTPGAAGASFSMVPLAVFSGVSGLISGVFTGGRSAVTAYHQNKHNQMQIQQDTKLDGLNGRVQNLEYARPANRRLDTIIAQGPRKDQSFAETELENRTEASPTDRTIH